MLIVYDIILYVRGLVYMKIKVGVSNRHVHLCESDYSILFGNNILQKKVDLNQPGEFASIEVVTIRGKKGEISNVRVLGPFRNYTQVEVSKTDTFKLGVNPPVASSGDLDHAEEITIIGPMGEITRQSCIIANRHIHVDHEIIKQYNLQDIKEVKVSIDGDKGGILDHVLIKESPHAYFELHLDTDDANAFLLKQDDLVEIIPKN